MSYEDGSASKDISQIVRIRTRYISDVRAVALLLVFSRGLYSVQFRPSVQCH